VTPRAEPASSSPRALAVQTKDLHVFIDLLPPEERFPCV
jgi:hypothetical protein